MSWCIGPVWRMARLLISVQLQKHLDWHVGSKSEVCSGEQSRGRNSALVAGELDNLGKFLALSELASLFINEGTGLNGF